MGCLLGGYLGDRLGRVNGFRVAACVGILGGAVQTGAVDQAMVCLCSFYFWISVFKSFSRSIELTVLSI